MVDRYGSVQASGLGDREVGDAVEALRRMRADRPERGPRAVELIRFILRGDPNRASARVQHLDALLEMADGVPETPDWVRDRACARTAALMYAAAEQRITDPGAALAELDELERQAAGAPGAHGLFHAARSGLQTLQMMLDGDRAGMRDLSKKIEKLPVDVGGNPALEPFANVLRLAAEVAAANQRGEDVFGLMKQLRAAADRLPPGHHLREVVEQAAGMIAPFEGMMRGDAPVMLTGEQLAAMSGMAASGGFDPALAHAGAGGAALGAGRETDPERVELGIGHFRAALAAAGPGHPQWAFFLFSIALGLMRRSELTNSLADLREVESLLVEAVAVAGGPHHELWPEMHEMLAHARQRIGAQSPRKQALEGLRAHTWRVLLQSDLGARNTAAREAAENALHVARICLAEGDPDDAIQALDAGRGLALYAATETRNVAGRLVETGRVELAERWRAAAGQGADRLPTSLRREVLTALREDDAVAGLLDPPTPAEIRDALRDLDLDALVYLVPGEAPQPGHAVIATAGGSAYMPLPSLVLGPGLDVERHLAALSVRSVPSGAPPTRELSAPETAELVRGLDGLCDWAWRAAIGPLLERGLAGVRRPRVVLVPVGELARVPWAAARRPSDGTYAVQLAELSQAASARMLCHSARLAPVVHTPMGLVVGDPDTRGEGSVLRAARLEAYAVQQTFYRAGRYLGRWPTNGSSPAGAGTADEVRAWLTDTGPAAGATLHLACHGVIRSDPGAATSYLLLAGGERLTAEELAELGPAPGRAVGLVVLAACRTGQSINGYDEAYSLGTALLAGGVRSVLSTLWAIPDAATSALMFMFHHHLADGGLAPRAALRAAQLWMLDPHRAWPARMPAQLRRELAAEELPKVAAWAGFVHWGQ